MFIFFFNDTATTEIYTLSLHDALPICRCELSGAISLLSPAYLLSESDDPSTRYHRITDRKSTRLNSSHSQISYAVFCLKKKKHSSFTLRPRISSLHSVSVHSLLIPPCR